MTKCKGLMVDPSGLFVSKSIAGGIISAKTTFEC